MGEGERGNMDEGKEKRWKGSLEKRKGEGEGEW